MARDIVPLANLARRPAEAGRIRLGEKGSKGEPKSIDTFRFTSAFKEDIEALAAKYGGTVSEWSDAKVAGRQWQVKTRASQIEVILPPHALTSHYELWSGGGAQRRCDGVECEVPVVHGNEWEMQKVPCMCVAANRMQCRPYTRINVVLPDLPMRGVWRLETKGWNAAAELPGMADMIDVLTSRGTLVRASLSVVRRAQSTPAGKRNFVVPMLALQQSATEALAGLASAQNLAIGAAPSSTFELNAGPSPDIESGSTDDGIVDAELVSDEEMEVRDCAVQYGVDPVRLWAAIHRTVHDGDTSKPAPDVRLRSAIDAMKAGRLQPIGFNPDGSVIWEQSS